MFPCNILRALGAQWQEQDATGRSVRYCSGSVGFLKNPVLGSEDLPLRVPEMWFGNSCITELSEMLDPVTEKSPSED